MGKKEDLRVIKTKKNLYEALLLLLKEYPFEDIKVSDICKKSLTNRSTFYDHFNDKYELLDSFIKDFENELAEKLNENEEYQSVKEYYLKAIALLFDHISENIDIYHSIIKNNNNSVAYDMVMQALFKDIEENLVSKHQYHGSIPIELVTAFYVSGASNVCLYYITDPKTYKKEDILNYLNELLPDNIY